MQQEMDRRQTEFKYMLEAINININLNNLCSYHLLVTFRFNKVLINLKIDCRKSLRATSTISKDGDFHTLTINIIKMEIKLVFRNYEVKCNVCKTNQGKFSFPIDEEKPQKWMTSMGIDRPKIVGANSSRFCLDHFSLNQFSNYSWKGRQSRLPNS